MSTLLPAAFLFLADAATASDAPGIVATGTLTVSASAVTALVTWLAAKRHAEATRPLPIPQPFEMEQSHDQANWKANEHDHENIFFRLATLEKQQAAMDAKLNSELVHINTTLNRLADSVQKLHDALSDRPAALCGLANAAGAAVPCGPHK